MKHNFNISKKIEFAEISANAHGWTYQQIEQFRTMHLTGTDKASQKAYLDRLLGAIDAYRAGSSIEDILYYPNSLGIAS